MAKVEPECKEHLPDSGQGRVFIAEDRGVVRLTLSNPGKLNALNAAMWVDLAEAFNGLSLRKDLRCIVVSGAGTEAFAAGADISEFETVRNTRDQVEQYHENVVPAALDAIAACDVPVVAAIRGACIGGGLEIASVCDIRVCDSVARFGAPVGRLGFPMAPREFRYLIRLLGASVVAELLLEGRIFDAAQAQLRGIVTEVYEPESFDTALARTVEHVCRGSPSAARINKRQIRDFLAQAAPPSLEERREFYKFANSDDYRAGRVAFLQKETPVFTGT